MESITQNISITIIAIIQIFFYVSALIMVIIGISNILKKAGFNSLLVFIIFIPLGVFYLLYILGYTDWPALKHRAQDDK